MWRKTLSTVIWGGITLLAFIIILITMGCSGGKITKLGTQLEQALHEVNECGEKIDQILADNQSLNSQLDIASKQNKTLTNQLNTVEKKFYEEEQARVSEFKASDKTGDIEITIDPGDTLSFVSLVVYKDVSLWPIIWWENINNIKNPDLIYPGQVFLVRNIQDVTEEEKYNAKTLHRRRYAK